MSIEHQIHGVWIMHNWKANHQGKDIESPWGPPNVWHAFFIFDKSGYCSYSASARERSHHKVQHEHALHTATMEEKAKSYDSYFNVLGKYSVEEKSKILNVHPKLCTFQNWVGKALKWSFEVGDDNLMVEVPSLFHEGKDVVKQFHFKRAA